MNINSQKFGSGISALVIGGLFFLAALHLKVNQGYSDFIVGSLAWYAGNKFQDLIALPIFILVSFSSYLAVSRISSGLNAAHGPAVSAKFISQLILWALPFYMGIATLFLGGVVDIKAQIVSALGIVSLSFVGFVGMKSLEKPDPSRWSAILFIALLASLIPIEVAVLLSRVPNGLVGELDLGLFIRGNNILIGIGFILGVIAITKVKEITNRDLSKFFLAAQLGLPLFYLTLYPAKILQPSGEVISYETTFYLRVLVITLVVYGIYDVVKRFRLSVDADWQERLSPFALFALLVALKVGHTVAPHISPDDYHFGEHLLGWWSYLRGLIPYVDYIPAHGLVENDLKSALSYFFYDGTAASIGEVGRLAFALLGLIAFMSLYRFTGSLALAFFVILMLGWSRLAWLFFTPFICIWLSPSLRKTPSKWLSVWIITAPIVILGVPPQGLLLVAAFGSLALKIACDQIQLGNKRSWKQLAIVVVVVFLVLFVTPLGIMLFGAIRYVIENGPVNQIAYGVPWSLGWSGDAKFRFVFEVIRMSWVAVPIFCLYIMFSNRRNLKDSGSIFYTALIFLCFSLLLIPYSMGRIDPGGVSRPGLASIFGWAILFPLLFWDFSKAKYAAFVILVSVFMSTLLGFGIPSLSRFSSIAAQKIHSSPLRDSDAAGLPNIGRAYMEENQWNRINGLNKLINSKLDIGEIYLDLTSRNAHYFYLNRLPAMPITAPYNLVSPSQQKRIVKSLTASPPQIALLEAANITHDGGGLAMRNPQLYRFVIDNYSPRMEGGFIIGYIKPDRVMAEDGRIFTEIKDFTDQNWLRGFNRIDSAVILSDPILVSMLQAGDQIRFGKNGKLRSIIRVWPEGSSIWVDGGAIPHSGGYTNSAELIVSSRVHKEYVSSLFQRSLSVLDYQKIPVSWGRSANSLKDKMDLIGGLDGLTSGIHDLVSESGNYIIKGNDPQVIFDVSSLNLSGRDAGLLKFDFNCFGGSTNPRLQIFWWGDDRNGPFEASSIKFSPENGALIVPLDASPWWLTLRKISGIRIDLDQSTACNGFSVKNIGLYQRVSN
jgi:hypothetical protein